MHLKFFLCMTFFVSGFNSGPQFLLFLCESSLIQTKVYRKGNVMIKQNIFLTFISFSA